MSLQRPNLLHRFFSEHARVSVAALGRQWREPLSTMLTALVIGITLALPAGLQLLVENLRDAAGGLQQTRTITLFLRDRVSPDDGANLARALAERAGVEDARYTSREDALRTFRERTALGGVLDALGENPLPASIAIIPGESLSNADHQRLAQEMIGQDEVEQVQQDSVWSARLSAALAVGSRLALVLAFGLGLAAVLSMGNTIRLDIESRRKEILVMKLVGAPPSFIRRPFLYAGFWYGLVGGLVAIFAIFLAGFALSGPVRALVELYEGAFSVRGPNGQMLLIVLAAGAALGLAGAWLAVSRHLGKIELR
tara:strand:- start:1609 stop:2544 length:936 start_codon:yes stop_codon:yes gene_type:complete